MRLSKAFILSGIKKHCSVRQKGIKRFLCQEVGNLPGWPHAVSCHKHSALSNEDFETSIKDHSVSGEEMNERIDLLSLGQHVVLCGVRGEKEKEKKKLIRKAVRLEDYITIML